MTIDLQLNNGVFVAPTYKDWLRENGIFLASGVMLLIVPSLIGYRKWRANGKDIGGRGTIIPEYTPPKDLTVLEASAVQSYRVDTKALSATIIDLAIRGYITIHETEKKKVLGLGGGQSYSFELINTDKSTLKTHETRILDSLFPTYEEGQYAEIGDTSTAMTTSYTFISTDIPERLTNAGYFTGNPKKVGTGMVILGVIALIGGFVLLGVMAGLVMSPIAALPGIGLLCSGILLLIFGVLMPKRTQLGEDTTDTLKGLKLFIETTEADRIKMMQSPNSPYANKTDEPHKTVELFETLLPYAMIFGIEKQWAKQFEKLYTQQPDWYDGNFSTFSAVYLVSALSSASTTMQSSFTPASSSGSGGGGGFSGGGSGGGGGGGW